VPVQKRKAVFEDEDYCHGDDGPLSWIKVFV